MSGLSYIVAMSFKNWLLELPRKPAKLILYVIAIAGIAGLSVMSASTRRGVAEFLDPAWLRGAFFVFIVIFVVMSVRNGLSSGNAIFGMDDVNLLFVSPVDSRPILLYGIVRMTRMAFFVAFFLLFQSNSLGAAFGVDFGGVLLLLFALVMALILLFTLSLIIYSATNGRPARKTAAKVVCFAAFAPLVIYALTRLAGTGGAQDALMDAIRSPFFAFTPVAGWTSAGAVALIEGDAAGGLPFLGLDVLAIAALIAYIAFSNPDYYEDVLVATETAFEKKRDVAEGRINVEPASSAKVKVTRTGVGGAGARALFHKHLRESFRANRFGLWGTQSALMVAGAALFAVFAKDSGSVVILQVLMWMQIFFIGMGRGLKELYSPYIYLIPEPPFPKIVWSNLEVVFKIFVESLFIFVIAGFITGEAPSLTVAAIAAYTMFALLLIGVNCVSLRFTGADISMGLLMFIYVIAVLVIIAPGVVLAVVTGAFIGGPYGTCAGLAVLTLWELAAALVCFALSKGVLHNCDMPAVKPKY